MSYEVCKGKWIAEGKDHTCSLIEGHLHKCVCDCGNRARVVNQLASFKIKPYYKRQKY
jgi:hypothetical protein